MERQPGRILSLRPAEPSDIPLVREMIHAEKLDESHEEDYLDGILPNREITIAEVGGEIAGFIVVQNPKDADWSAINYVVVLPEFRSQNVGSQLMRTSEAKLQEQGKKSISVIVKSAEDGKPEPRLSNFYRELGYERVWGHGGLWVEKKFPRP